MTQAGSDKSSSEQKPFAKGGRRIAKVIARAGLASRREAEAWIAAGRVAVNGVVITSPAVKVGARDTVTVDGKPLPQHERTRLFLFHKPRGLVTTTADPQGRPTVFDALPKHLPRLVTVGRLDFNTEGLLLLTNDGGLARVLEHPQTGWLRRYRVRAHGNVGQAQLDALRDGITIDGIHYGPIEATLDRQQGSNVWLTFAIREGKNREVRNVLSHLGLAVNRLIRISFGPFQLGDLPEGAIEEVRTRVLREQLGKKIAALADADFDAPLLQRQEAGAEPQRETRSPRGRETRAPRESRPPRERTKGAGDRSRPSLAGRPGHRARNDGERPVRNPPVREQREGSQRPRPWRGQGRERPITETAPAGEAPRKTRAGLLTDRKGRRVLVERVQGERPERAQQRRERRPDRPAPGRPPRDRRGGPRPSHPRAPRDRE